MESTSQLASIKTTLGFKFLKSIQCLCFALHCTGIKYLLMILLWLTASLLTSALCRRHRNFVHISGEDDECTTPHNVEGECIPLRQCEPVMSLLRGGMTQQKMAYIRHSMCKFTGVVTTL